MAVMKIHVYSSSIIYAQCSIQKEMLKRTEILDSEMRWY